MTESAAGIKRRCWCRSDFSTPLASSGGCRTGQAVAGPDETCQRNDRPIPVASKKVLPRAEILVLRPKPIAACRPAR